MPSSPGPPRDTPSSSRARREAILLGWSLCALLDIAAAFGLAWWQASRGPAAVLKGIASALIGPTASAGGAGIAAIGLLMHLGVALAWTLVFVWLASRSALVRTAPLGLVGPLYGAFVFSAMNYAVLPAASWARSLYLETPARWPAGMGWPLLVVHLVCVGLPIAWAIRRGWRVSA